jgi:hypothetical protein
MEEELKILKANIDELTKNYDLAINSLVQMREHNTNLIVKIMSLEKEIVALKYNRNKKKLAAEYCM